MGRPQTYSDELRRRAIDDVIERDREVPELGEPTEICPRVVSGDD